MSDSRSDRETVCGREWPPEWIRNSDSGPLLTRIWTGFIVLGTVAIIAAILLHALAAGVLIDMAILLVLGVLMVVSLFTVGWMVIDMPIQIKRWLLK